MQQLLKFGRGNAKLHKGIHHFSLPSGYSCPFALTCLSKANKETGKIKDGPNTTIRCFSASQEALYPGVRKQRWNNFELLKGKNKDEMTDLILRSLPKNAKIIRIHVAGNHFSQDYFDSWLETARQKPKIKFYAYTKSIPYWIARKDDIPKNMILTASYGGRFDDLIKKHKLKSAKIVLSKAEAKQNKLQLDHDDSHAQKKSGDFALLVHGIQPKGSKAAKAIQTLRSKGIFGYGSKSK